MPRYRKSKRGYKPRANRPLGDTFDIKMKYCEQISLNAGTGSVATYSFLANDVYDPTVAVGGHQALGFDEMADFFNHFTVLSSKIRVDFVSTTTDPVASCNVVGIELSGNSTPTVAINDVYEQGSSRYRILTNANAKQAIRVNHGVNCSKFLGQWVMDEDSNAGWNGGSPQELIYYHIFTTGVEATSNPQAINALVEITYTVRWHEPRPLLGS